MQLPFTSEQFFDVFERYNTDLPYSATVLGSIAAAIIGLLFARTAFATRAVMLLFGLLWAWTGIVYHILYFTSINPAAYIFGSLFVLQAVLFIQEAIRTRSCCIGLSRDAATGTAAAMVIYAVLVYPLIGHALGHEFPRTPTFGLPCPLTIFTLGVLTSAGRNIRWYLLAVPLAWALFGSSAAVLFGIWQDIAMAVAASSTLVIYLTKQADG